MANKPLLNTGNHKKGEPVITVSDLSVDFFVGDRWVRAVDNISYDIKRGELLGIVGESGSGKSQSSMSLIGLLPPNGRATGKAVLHTNRGDVSLIDADKRTLQKIRGPQIATIFQEPMTALNPVYTIGFQIIETIRTHTNYSQKQALERAINLLEVVEIPEPEKSINKYPHQLSGGQRQRAMIAMALSLDPELLIADEPTTALDVTVQAEILKLLRDLKEKINTGIILITHDMGVIAEMADKIIVMNTGKIVESGPCEEIFYNPKDDYTKLLLDSVPKLGKHNREKANIEKDAQTVLSAKNVILEYPKSGRTPVFRAVNDFNLTIKKGQVVGLIGESGSGKTTVGRGIVGLLPPHKDSGELKVAGRELVGANRKQIREALTDVSIVFQDPGSSLNPRMTIGDSIGEPIKLRHKLKGDSLRNRVNELLDSVLLPNNYINRYPHELSGGQRQRVGIARSLALKPKLLIADEPTSALDVSIQATVLTLFKQLQQEYGFGCLFITHDLAVAEIVSSELVVMNKGDIVEYGETETILSSPKNEYTKRLIDSVPIPEPKRI